MSEKTTCETHIARIARLEQEVAEKDKLSAQLRQAQKMEAVGTLAGGIAHDFNNILQGISGYAEILLQSKDPENPDFSNLSAILKAAERGTRLVRQLLLFSRRAATQKKALNINQTLEQAKNFLERVIPKMIDISISPAQDLWEILGDPVQIEQVLLNLGTNSADAMPDGGRLKIKTENITLHKKDFPAPIDTVPGNYVLIRVSDTGHAMTQETIKKIFDPFFTTKETGKGTGLGLASAYGIVKSHDGYIFCQSEPGSGTVFSIYLPAIKQKSEQPETLERQYKTRGGKETILVVDDEKSIIDIVCTILNQFGYRTLTASNGKEALERQKTFLQEIDLVILDMGMPEMGGQECLKELLKCAPHTRIIISSGFLNDTTIDQCLKLGAVGYIGKPFMVRKLLQSVRSVLDKGQPYSQDA